MAELLFKQAEKAAPERLLTRQEVARVISVGIPTLDRMVKRGEFPRPVKVGPQLVRWSAGTVQAWIQEQTERASSGLDQRR